MHASHDLQFTNKSNLLEDSVRNKNQQLLLTLVQTFALLLLATTVFAQETTGGLQGTVRDQSGAVLSKAHVVLTGSTLVGDRTADTDGSGYYHFANLPPGTYTVTVTARGFSTYKSAGLVIEVGHLPTLDIPLAVGTESTVVEVNATPPVIDVTTTHTINNITEDVINNVPTGRSYQSVIQFAPAARNEPLAGNNVFYGAGTGGSSISSSSNGQAYGYSVAGAADSENSYLVEGQDTSNIASGFSMASVPFDFIQEVQVKSSGIEAEHGGSLGGVVNVVMRKGSNALHGSLFANWEGDQLDAFPNAYPRYDPSSLGSPSTQQDVAGQGYKPKKDHTRVMQTGGTLGGALIRDRLFFFLGFEPEMDTLRRDVNWNNGTIVGLNTFNQSRNTYFGTGRLDAAVTQKIHVFGSWLYQYQRETGSQLPVADSTSGLLNISATSPITNFPGGAGFTAPNQTVNVGGDIALSSHLVSTTRFGYFIQNYHDFGYPTGFPAFFFATGGTGALINSPAGCTASTCQTIAAGTPLSQNGGYTSALLNGNYTAFNDNKHYQFDEDFSWFKSGLGGTHNIKVGYQLNHLYNNVLQRSNLPQMIVFPGVQNSWAASTQQGRTVCATLASQNSFGSCAGTYGYGYVYDIGTDGKASNYNHGLFVQDAWTIGRGLTLNLGIRADKEYLPAYQAYEGLTAYPINFKWSDKIAPRVGAAYDVFKNGKMKVFGSYGVYYDMMKLNLAISSFGGQYWNNCAYAINTNDLSAINFAYNAAGRACSGLDPTAGANFSGTQDPNLTFIENQNNRTPEYVVPNLKPYRQHDSAFGVDYQLKKGLALEARWDRRRLDRAIEDASFFNPVFGEAPYLIVNPGFAPNNTFNGYALEAYTLNDKLYGCATPGSCPTGPTAPLESTLLPCVGTGCLQTSVYCPGPATTQVCPPPPKAVRSYDGVEIRLTATGSSRFSGMVSYTYSSLRGNYSGLTSTDISDSSSIFGGGRASPNNSRYFDEPWFSYTANGTLENGRLATDRPNVFKGYGYFKMPWHWKGNSTNIGLFQYLYQGSPLTSYLDVGGYYSGAGGQIDQYPVGRYWVDATQTGGSGPITVGPVTNRRTPWYIQSDLQLQHEVKVGESKRVAFEFTAPNVLNQHSVTAYVSQIDSGQLTSFLSPNGLSIGNAGAFYAAAMHPYNWTADLNSSGVILNSNYGKPLYYQLPRTIRLAVRYTF